MLRRRAPEVVVGNELAGLEVDGPDQVQVVDGLLVLLVLIGWAWRVRL